MFAIYFVLLFKKKHIIWKNFNYIIFQIPKNETIKIRYKEEYILDTNNNIDLLRINSLFCDFDEFCEIIKKYDTYKLLEFMHTKRNISHFNSLAAGIKNDNYSTNGVIFTVNNQTFIKFHKNSELFYIINLKN